MSERSGRLAWQPFCAAVEALVEWEQQNPNLVGPWDQIAARADALGTLSAFFEDEVADPLPLSELFRLRGLPDAEAMALSMCSGRVLDVGAGSGVHSLMLQEQGVDVTAMDAEPELVTAMQSRGVQNAICDDITVSSEDRGNQTWDTLLFMMNGLGLCGDLKGLRRLLVRCHRMVRSGGMILADGCDLRQSPAPEEARRIRRRKEAGRHFGEAHVHMVFEPRASSAGESVEGESFRWLYLDYATLESVATEAGWSCQCVYSAGPEYLARLGR